MLPYNINTCDLVRLQWAAGVGHVCLPSGWFDAGAAWTALVAFSERCCVLPCFSAQQGQHGDCTCDLSTPLGSGSFGLVVPGHYYDEPVAVKLLSPRFGEDEAAVRSKILKEVQLQVRRVYVGMLDQGAMLSESEPSWCLHAELPAFTRGHDSTVHRHVSNQAAVHPVQLSANAPAEGACQQSRRGGPLSGGVPQPSSNHHGDV